MICRFISKAPEQHSFLRNKLTSGWSLSIRKIFDISCRLPQVLSCALKQSRDPALTFQFPDLSPKRNTGILVQTAMRILDRSTAVTLAVVLAGAGANRSLFLR